MTVFVNSKKLKAIQIGAVGTIPEYRNRGFARQLMEYVVDTYQEEFDLFFLFANNSVLDFYPKFGFKPYQEYLFVREANIPDQKFSARKLNFKDQTDYQLLVQLIQNRLPLTQIFGAENYGEITMWHVLNYYRNNLYYIEDENTIVIKQESEKSLEIIDVIFSEPINWEAILPQIIEDNGLKSITYHFPPDQIHYQYGASIEEETGLFILGDVKLNESVIRFPSTAVT